MRAKPVGTGPFKVVEFKRGESVSLARNPDYWKKGLPLLDRIEYRVIDNRSTRVLAFIAGEVDLTFVSDITVAGLKDITAQAPNAKCQFVPSNNTINMIVNAGRAAVRQARGQEGHGARARPAGLQHHPRRRQVDDRRGDAAGP